MIRAVFEAARQLSLGCLEKYVLAPKEAKSEDNVFRCWNYRNFLSLLRTLRYIFRIRPHIVHIFDQYGVLGFAWVSFILPIYLVLRMLRIPVVTTIYYILGFSQHIKAKRNGPLAGLLHYIYWKIALACSTVAVAYHQRHILLAQYYMKRAGVIYIPLIPPADVSHSELRHEVRARLGLEDKVTFIVFGFLRRDKGMEYIVEALSLLPRDKQELVRLLIVGEALDKMYLKELQGLISAIKLGCDVQFVTDFINGREITEYFLASDVCLVTGVNRWDNPISGPLRIAFAFAKPIIVTRDLADAYTIDDFTAIIVPPRNVDRLAIAIERLLNKDERDRLSLNIKDLKGVNVEDITKRWIDIYRSIMINRI
ncbi:MAG: glycosyltransferase [archaeon]|nr:glycosyltransferase [archaeon]MCP8319372.1 glycosyltransferase [archaeon]